jgi:MFS family permease
MNSPVTVADGAASKPFRDAHSIMEREEPPISEKDASCSTVESHQSEGDEEMEDTTVYPSKIKLVFIVMGLDLSSFLVGLDNTILSTAIPKITDQFHALDDVGWYASSYLLTTCAFQLFWGKLHTYYSVKWTYLVALFVFELGSLICGVAPTSAALIAGRAVAGAGTGGVNAGAYILVAHSVPKPQRPTLLGLIGGMYGFASIAGPLVGGAFTDNPKLTWRWCFYINLPLGLITAVVVLCCVRVARSNKTLATSIGDQVKQMDIPGTACLLPGVLCLILGLQWGGSRYPWSSGRIIALFVLAGVLSIGFVAIQIWSGERATVPPRVFRNRNIWGSAIFGGCLTACFFVMLYYVREPPPSVPHQGIGANWVLLGPHLVSGHQRSECC